MRLVFRLLTLTGILLLTAGVGLYIRYALTKEGDILWSFLCLMMSLLFFNLPVVIQKRMDRD
jgi:hypothetical protein